MLDNKVVTINATASEILQGDSDGGEWMLVNKTGEVLYLGASDVTADTTAGTGGFQVAIDAVATGRVKAGDSLCGVTASTGGAVPIMWN